MAGGAFPTKLPREIEEALKHHNRASAAPAAGAAGEPAVRGHCSAERCRTAKGRQLRKGPHGSVSPPEPLPRIEPHGHV